MRIEIAEIPRHGRDLSMDGPAVAALAGESLDAQVQSARASLTVRRKGDGAVVVGSISAQAIRPCDRCGRDTPFAVEGSQTLVFVPRSRLSPTDGEVELSESDLDVGFFDGTGLDLDDVSRELFALAAPFRVTCARLDCDAAAAADAGGEDDGEASSRRPSPFAALKDHFD